MMVSGGLLRHFLAAIAYRTAKALRGAPQEYEAFAAGMQVRTPLVIGVVWVPYARRS
jgi:hypothetical protein